MKAERAAMRTAHSLRQDFTKGASALDGASSGVQRAQSATPWGALHGASHSPDRLVAALVVMIEQAHRNRNEAAATLPSSSGLGTG